MQLRNELLSAVAVLCVLFSIPGRGAERSDSVRGSNLALTASRIGASVVFNAAITAVLKNSIHRERPNDEDDHSFPSRHTSWAFTASTILSNEFYRTAPWVPVGAQTLASVVGVQRVAAGCHYGTDVIGGAAVGIASTELAYILGRVVFKRKFIYTPVDVSELENKWEIVSNTTALILFDYDGTTGISAEAGARMPLKDKISCTGTLYYLSFPFMVTSVGVKAGLSYRKALRGPFEIEGAAGGGLGYRTGDYACDGVVGITYASVGSAMYLTERFAVTASAGYQYIGMPEGLNCLSISLGTRARF